jgi:DUF4097 and DUF4098 domain-containing protein YvlB
MMKQTMKTWQRTAVVPVLALASILAPAQSKQEKRVVTGPKPIVSVMNQYGPVSVHPGAANQVVITYILASGKVEVDQHQTGDRILFETHLLPGSTPQTGRVEYEVFVPVEAAVVVHSSDGPILVEKLRGDVSVEGATAQVQIREISGAHVHIKTLSGPVSISSVQEGHVEVTSISGDVLLSAVSGPFVDVNSASGKITYDGNFGGSGNYKLSSHTGDIEADLAPDTSMDFTAKSMTGFIDDQYPLAPKTHSAFAPQPKGRVVVGTAGKAGSSVLINTFSGKIRVKKH